MPTFNKPDSLNEVWASNGIISSPQNLKISQGWTVEIPPYQYFNWSQNRVDSFMAHINQSGIPVWDSITEYTGNKSYVQGSDGVIYKAKITNTNIDPANALNRSTWGIAFEVYGSVAVVQTQLDALQTNYNTLANIANYPQARQNLSVWSRVESDSRFAYKLGDANTKFSAAWATADSHVIPLGQLNSLIAKATTQNIGTARIATTTEVEQAILDDVIVTPETGAAVYLKKSNNLADIPNKALARQNLGITEISQLNPDDFLKNVEMVGQISHFFRTTAPNGWLICDGREVSRTTYARLFEAIGVLGGAGDGVTTFNLPDFRNEFLRGWTGISTSIGTKRTDSLKSHTHTGTASSGGSHLHPVSISSAGAHVHAAVAASGGSHSHSGSTDTTGSHSHSFSYAATTWSGSAGAAAGDGYVNRSYSSSTSSAGSHSHSLSISSGGAHTHTVDITSGGAHTHTGEASVAGDHTHTLAIGNTGESETAPRHIHALVCIRF